MSHHAINKETNTNNCVITEKTYLNKIRKKTKPFLTKRAKDYIAQATVGQKRPTIHQNVGFLIWM